MMELEKNSLPFNSHGGTTEFEWQYTMRREMQEIIPGLYLGPYSTANRSQLAHLQELGITHIVCVKHPGKDAFIRANFPEHFRYLVLDIADNLLENIIKFFQPVKIFLDECLSSGGKALVHGNTGISRSAALVIAYIMEKYASSYIDAFHYVQRKRFCINPNEGFTRQLMEYEPLYRARRQITASVTSPNGSSGGKRKFEDDDDDDVREMDSC